MGEPGPFDNVDELEADELRVRLRSLVAIIERAPVPIAIAHDPACRVITANRALATLLRLPGDANISLTPPPDQEPPYRIQRDGRDLDTLAMIRPRAAALALLMIPAPPSAPQAPTFSATLEAVRVDVLVTDSGRLVRGLGPADFEVRDNGVLQRVDLCHLRGASARCRPRARHEPQRDGSASGSSATRRASGARRAEAGRSGGAAHVQPCAHVARGADTRGSPVARGDRGHPGGRRDRARGRDLCRADAGTGRDRAGAADRLQRRPRHPKLADTRSCARRRAALGHDRLQCLGARIRRGAVPRGSQPVDRGRSSRSNRPRTWRARSSGSSTSSVSDMS